MIATHRLGSSFTRNVVLTSKKTTRMLSVKNISVMELNDILKSKNVANYQLIDVREKNELAIVKFKNDVVNIPMSRFTTESLDKDKPTIVICHHGMRSLR